METYRVKLKLKEEVARDTMAFHFEKPGGLEFKAGQSAKWTIVESPDPDAENESHTLSIASAPYEDGLMFGTRMRDSVFKRAISKMEPGDELELKGPQGSFRLHSDESTPAVFLTGGIGVTAVRSIVLQALRERPDQRIHVLYSNRTPEDAAFLRELDAPQKDNANYTFTPTMTEPQDSDQPWDGETGHIDKTMLEKYIGDLSQPIFYVDGPPDMVEDLSKMLEEAGVDEDRIRTEEFMGY